MSTDKEKEEEVEAVRRAREARRPHACHAALTAAMLGFCHRCGAARIVGEPHAPPCKPSTPSFLVE